MGAEVIVLIIAGAFAGGASYGKDKAVETLGNNFDGMDLMQRLALMWQVITGNKQGAMERLGAPGGSLTSSST